MNILHAVLTSGRSDGYRACSKKQWINGKGSFPCWYLWPLVLCSLWPPVKPSVMGSWATGSMSGFITEYRFIFLPPISRLTKLSEKLFHTDICLNWQPLWSFAVFFVQYFVLAPQWLAEVFVSFHYLQQEWQNGMLVFFPLPELSFSC